MAQVIIGVHGEFKRQLKALAKKYHSIKEDYASFLDGLTKNPFQGVDLGNGVRKMRMSISSKGKGKSAGARVITYNVELLDNDELHITLLTIYDKNEISNVSDAYIRSLIKNI
ncbi:MAG: type II toxin-antitoxin system RelE/ParE family toxin [Paludibacteraceae bacterium]|nr:type II toxin-antitoxin system RelE/ParE family toxin [Paludibacteraceae bacterium]